MKYDVSEILKDVRVILDNNSTSDQLLNTDDIDTLTLNELIRSKIVDALKFCITSASVHLLGVGKPFDNIQLYWDNIKGIGSGYFILPEDFFRLVTFQMSDWSRPISLTISEDDPLYARQKSKYCGIKGNTTRPVAAVVNHPEGQVIEFYSCKEGESVYVKYFRYIPIPAIKKGDCGEYIEISEKLYDAVKYYTAYLVSLTLGMDIASALIDVTKTYLQ